jgi:hypothetical protein
MSQNAHGIEVLNACGDQGAGISPVFFPVNENLEPAFFPVMERISVISVVSGKVFPVLPQVFENGILSAYVSPSVPSK